MAKAYLFIGPPGSGKDTQAEIVSEKLGLLVASPGEALREEVQSGSDEGRVAKEYMDRGDLVPDELTLEVLRKYLGKVGTTDLILTGIPRRVHQIDSLHKVLNDLGISEITAVYFVLNDAEAIKRLSGRWYAPTSNRTYHEIYNPPKVAGKCDVSGETLVRRPDDEPEAVSERLKVYHAEMAPVVEYYRRLGTLIEVDAAPPIPEVTTQLLAKIEWYEHN